MILSRRLNYYLQWLLLGLCALFLIDLGIEMSRDYSIRTPKAGIERISPPKDTSGVSTPVPPHSDYAEITKRPLFSDTRQPYIPEENSEKDNKQPNVPPDILHEEFYSLSGVVITKGEKLALILKQPDNKIHRLREGNTLDGWIVSDVQSTRVLLKKGAEEKTLELLVKTMPTRTAGPATSGSRVLPAGVGRVKQATSGGSAATPSEADESGQGNRVGEENNQ